MITISASVRKGYRVERDNCVLHKLFRYTSLKSILNFFLDDLWKFDKCNYVRIVVNY